MNKLLCFCFGFLGITLSATPAEEFEYRFSSTGVQEQSFTGGGSSNQFPRARGVYNGLIQSTTDFVVERSGFFKIWVDSDRDFSGRLDFAEDSIPLRGHFDRQGEAGVWVYRRIWDDDCFCFYWLRLAWIVQLNLIPGTDEIEGTIENVRGGWTTELFGYRGYGTPDFPAPEAGRYTLRLPTGADPAVAPPGAGYGVARVTTHGQVQMTGTLPDGVQFNRSANISTNGWWPFYLPLNEGHGAVIGWLRFAATASSDVSGDLFWTRPRRVERRLYPDGYSGTIAASGSRYVPPSATELPLSWSDGVFSLSGGNLSASVANDVVFLPGGALTDSGGGIANLTFRLNRGSGVFSGRFVHPDTGRRTTYSGVLDQKADVGAGFFIGTDQGGLVRLEAAP